MLYSFSFEFSISLITVTFEHFINIRRFCTLKIAPSKPSAHHHYYQRYTVNCTMNKTLSSKLLGH